MKSIAKKGVIPKNTPRRHVSELITSYCRTRTLRSFEEVAEISHSFAIYVRDRGSLERGRAGDVAAALRRNGEGRLADDFLMAYLKDHIPPGEESRVSIELKTTKRRTLKDADATQMLEWLEVEIGRDPVIRDLVSAAYRMAHRQ
jgi:hypothetical protein